MATQSEIITKAKNGLDRANHTVSGLIEYLRYIFGELANASGGGSDNQHDYSTNEQVIGKWIDGKPLYEKTWENLSINTDGNNWVYFNTPTEIKDIISFDAFSNNSGKLLKCAIAELQRSDTNGIMFSSFSGFNRTVNVITAQYTKTTD